MIKNLGDWVNKINDADLTKVYKAYSETEMLLKNLEVELLTKLMKMPEFEERLAKAFHEDKVPEDKEIQYESLLTKVEPEPLAPLVSFDVITTGKEFKTVRKAKYLTQEQASQKLKIQLYLIRTWEQKGGIIEEQYVPKVQKLLKL